MLEIGILKNFESVNYKAGVQLAGSLTTYFDDISVAKNIPSSALVIGNYVIVAIPGDNPTDACVIATWPQGSPGGGAGSFLDLSDTPSGYSGQAGKVAKVNSGQNALEWALTPIHNKLARATLSTRQENILDRTYVKVLLDTPTFDPGGNFDTANHRYVAPVPGYYLVLGVTVYYWSGLVLDKEYYTVIRINGADYISLPVTPSKITNIGYLVVALVHLSANDYIELWGWIDAGFGAGNPTTVDIYEGESRTQLTVALYQTD
jgi:hypothetical protein